MSNNPLGVPSTRTPVSVAMIPTIVHKLCEQRLSCGDDDDEATTAVNDEIWSRSIASQQQSSTATDRSTSIMLPTTKVPSLSKWTIPAVAVAVGAPRRWAVMGLLVMVVVVVCHHEQTRWSSCRRFAVRVRSFDPLRRSSVAGKR